MMRHIRVGNGPRSAGCAGLVALALFFAVACGEDGEGDAPGVSGAGAGGPGGGGPGGDCGSNAADSACTACLKMNCCNEWKACRSEAACTPCSDCLGREQDLEKCDFASGMCAFMNTAEPTAQLLTCGLSGCEIECGF
jgi:hypothetical protein